MEPQTYQLNLVFPITFFGRSVMAVVAGLAPQAVSRHRRRYDWRVVPLFDDPAADAPPAGRAGTGDGGPDHRREHRPPVPGGGGLPVCKGQADQSQYGSSSHRGGAGRGQGQSGGTDCGSVLRSLDPLTGRRRLSRCRWLGARRVRGRLPHDLRDRPETGCGWIESGPEIADATGCHQVEHFHGKPDLATAHSGSWQAGPMPGTQGSSSCGCGSFRPSSTAPNPY